MQGESPSSCSMFLGGVPPESSLEEVYQAIRSSVDLQEGWLLELKGVKENCSHLGYGFIRCKTEAVANMFRRISFFVVKGKKVECKEGWSVEEHKKRTNQERNKKIFVSCIKKHTSKTAIMEYFATYGPVVDVAIGKDKVSGRKLGFCVVEFLTAESVAQVLLVHPHMLENKEIRCQKMLLKHELSSKPMPKYRNGLSPPAPWDHSHKADMHGIQKHTQVKRSSELVDTFKQLQSGFKLTRNCNWHGNEFAVRSSPESKPFFVSPEQQSSSKRRDTLKSSSSYEASRYLRKKPVASLDYVVDQDIPSNVHLYSRPDLPLLKGSTVSQVSPAVAYNLYNSNPSLGVFPEYVLGHSGELQPPPYYPLADKPGGSQIQKLAKSSDCYSSNAVQEMGYPKSAYRGHDKFEDGSLYGSLNHRRNPNASFGTLPTYSVPEDYSQTPHQESAQIISEGNLAKEGERCWRHKLPVKPHSLSNLPGPLEIR